MTTTESTSNAPGITLEPEQEERAARLHRNSIIIDGCHGIKYEKNHFARTRAAGITALNHTVTQPINGLTEALGEFQFATEWIAKHSDEALLVSSTDDIREAKRLGKEAIVFTPQHSEFLDRDLSRLGTFRNLGMRVMQLTYQTKNYLGDGCGEPTPGGLSRFGRDVVREMDSLGIVIDLSHTSYPTSKDAIELADGPTIFSHANVAALTPHVRTKEDDLIKAMAEKGGLIGLTALSVQNTLTPGQRPDLRDFLAHVQHLLDLVGCDHIAVGLDFHEYRTPELHQQAHAKNPELGGYSFEERRVRGISSSEEVPNVTRALVSIGLDDEEISKILGGNFLRVYDEIWGRA